MKKLIYLLLMTVAFIGISATVPVKAGNCHEKTVIELQVQDQMTDYVINLQDQFTLTQNGNIVNSQSIAGGYQESDNLKYLLTPQEMLNNYENQIGMHNERLKLKGPALNTEFQQYSYINTDCNNRKNYILHSRRIQPYPRF